MPLRYAGVCLSLLLTVCAGAQPERPRTEVHLFGADVTAGAPLAAWYRQIGLTDLWLYPVQGAFPQDQRPETQQTPEQLALLVAAYAVQGLRCWWLERPVPDVFYTQARTGARDLWDRSPETDALWAQVCSRIREVYPRVRAAGCRGLVYDNESYYSFQGDEPGLTKPWVWGGHAQEYGREGQYYRRGLQVGQAIRQAWPEATVIMVYAHGYEGERWWYQGCHDAGVRFLLGPEHTYGAGPHDLGDAWYQSWWQGRNLVQTCDWKRTQFPFLADNRQVCAGLFPIEFTTKQPNYRARYFREQLQQAAEAGIPVWLWPQGPFTPESWQQVKYAAGDSAEGYLEALREYGGGGEKENGKPRTGERREGGG